MYVLFFIYIYIYIYDRNDTIQTFLWSSTKNQTFKKDSKNMKSLENQKDYKIFLRICARHPHGEKLRGGAPKEIVIVLWSSTKNRINQYRS